MLKLMKYEFLRRQRVFLIALVILLFIEGAIIFCIYKGNAWIALGIILGLLLCYGSVLFVFIDSIASYSMDLNQKSGYSLFLTPTSGYKIIASKALISFIELLIVIGIVFGFVFLDIKFIDLRYSDQISEMTKAMIAGLKEVGFIPEIKVIVATVFVFFLEWFNMIMVAILAMTIRKTLLSNIKLGWLISFIFFIAIYTTLSTITMAVIMPLGYFSDMMELMNLEAAGHVPNLKDFNIFKYILASICLYAVYLPSLFFFSGKLLGKNVDL